MSNAGDVVSGVVLRKPIANGLAIIVANVRSFKEEHDDLPGAEKDHGAMLHTFNELQFATVSILNRPKCDITSAVEAAATLKYPPHYKRIAFVFSGHGDGDYIYTYEDSIDLQYDIYRPLMPGVSPHLAEIPKLFFIDACRGAGMDRGVRIPDGELVSRGGRAPSLGNYLLAYSTLPRMKAFEKPSGGYWSQHLANQLLVSEKSVVDVLTEVNGKMLDEFEQRDLRFLQQPHLDSTLRQPFSLLKEAREIAEINECAEFMSLHNLSLEDQGIDSILQSTAQPGNDLVGPQAGPVDQSAGFVVQPSQPWNPQSQNEYQHYGANAVAYTPISMPQNVTSSFARHHSAPSYEEYQPTVQGGGGSVYTHHAGWPGMQGVTAHSYGNTAAYQPTVNAVTTNLPGYYSGAGPGLQQGKGETESSHRPTVLRSLSAPKVSLMASRGCQSESVQKIWKSKLTEHFDKIGKPLESGKIKYKTKETPKGGFQSKVFVPGLGYAQGDVQRSKSEAEHDAARKALNELDQ